MTLETDAIIRATLIRNGYDPEAKPSGRNSRTGSTATWRGVNNVLLRFHVCYLDGIEIDGHEFSDLDPGSENCLHCGYDLDSKKPGETQFEKYGVRGWQWLQLFNWVRHSGENINATTVQAKMQELDPYLPLRKKEE